MDFPKHLSHKVREYVVTVSGYVESKGRDGLIREIGNHVPDGHWLLKTVRDAKYRLHTDQLVALRNFSSQEIPVSKRAALKAVDQQRMSSVGA